MHCRCLGSKSHEFLSRCDRDDLAATNSLCSAKAWMSLLIPSRHSLGEARIPRAPSRCECSMDQLRKAGGNGVRSIARTG